MDLVMEVTVKYFGWFEDLAGRKEEVISLPPGQLSTRHLMDLLCQKYGVQFREALFDASGRLKEGFTLLRNDLKSELRERLEDQDILYFLPFLAGG